MKVSCALAIAALLVLSVIPAGAQTIYPTQRCRLRDDTASFKFRSVWNGRALYPRKLFVRSLRQPSYYHCRYCQATTPGFSSRSSTPWPRQPTLEWHRADVTTSSQVTPKGHCLHLPRQRRRSGRRSAAHLVPTSDRAPAASCGTMTTLK